MISFILAALTGLAVLGLDQYTKYLIATGYSLGDSGKKLIFGIIDIVYVRNNGGAWGMLGGSTWLLISLTAVIMLVCIYLLIKYGLKNKLFFWAIVLVLSGGVGNMIDRILRKGFVVDFMQFGFWKSFPVFNVADCAIVVGAGMLILYFIGEMIKENRQKKQNAEKQAD